MKFHFIHSKSREGRTVEVPDDEIFNLCADRAMDLIYQCDFHPVGETNVVECNCSDYLDGFELQPMTVTDKNEVTVPMFVEVGKELYGSASFVWSLQTIIEGAIGAIEHQKRHDCDCEGHEGRFYTLLALKAYYAEYISHMKLNHTKEST